MSCKPSGPKAGSPAPDAQTVTRDTASFDWLLGDWKRANEAAGKATYEFWKKTSADVYSGFGFTLQDGDTIWQERMLLARKEGAWLLNIRAPEDPQPVVFEVTEMGDSTFTCENPENEFPDTIRYWRIGQLLYASVSNRELEIPFEFEPLEE